MYLVNNKLWVKLNTFSWIKLFNSLIPLSYQINDTRRSIRMIKNNWNWVEFHIRYNFNSASRKRSVLHGDRLDRCREVSFHFSRFAQARATERVRPRRHWPSFAIRMIRKLSSQHLTVLTGDERWKMGDERALVPPTRQRKREERRARVLSIRTARLATLSALTWTTLSVVATTGTLVTVTRDGTVTDIVVAIHASGCLAPLSPFFFLFFFRTLSRCYNHRCNGSPRARYETRFFLAVREVFVVVVVVVTDTQYILHRSLERIRARSLARTRAIARACVIAPLRSDLFHSRSLQPRDDDTPTRDAFDGHWTKWRASLSRNSDARARPPGRQGTSGDVRRDGGYGRLLAYC